MITLERKKTNYSSILPGIDAFRQYNRLLHFTSPRIRTHRIPSQPLLLVLLLVLLLKLMLLILQRIPLHILLVRVSSLKIRVYVRISAAAIADAGRIPASRIHHRKSTNDNLSLQKFERSATTNQLAKDSKIIGQNRRDFSPKNRWLEDFSSSNRSETLQQRDHEGKGMIGGDFRFRLLRSGSFFVCVP